MPSTADHPASRRSPFPLTPWLVFTGVLATLACEEDKAPTAPAVPAARAGAAAPDAAIGATPQGMIPLPVIQSFNGAALAFGITQTGTGPSGLFRIDNAANIRDALLAQTNGTGYALHAIAGGNGAAAKFENSKPGNGQNAVFVAANGGGNAISAVNLGIGAAGSFVKTSTTSTTSAVFAQNAGPGKTIEVRATGEGRAGHFENTSTSNPSNAIFARTRGTADAASFEINNVSSAAVATRSVTNGIGWAGEFRANSKTAGGVLIETNGGPGLQIFGGTKNAVVATTNGARALYTEESSEVWFTEYGFGKLENGRARILLDPAFAQTVNVEEPYQVFVQEYGDADLYVRERTPLGFEVVFRGGNDRNAEFGYRIVAKRRGFENQRLERAPWADAVAGAESHN